MKKINLFLSIGNEEVEQDRIELSDFVRHLNDIYEDYGLYFYLLSSKNDIKEEDVTSSEIYMILFENEVNEESKKEFKAAYREFKKNHKNPKIYTYVKNMEQEKSGTAYEFMQKLDKELGHFYKNYHNTDTIKLNMIMQLQNLGLEEIKFETKDHKLFLNNEEMLSLDNIPMFFNNKELNKLKEKYIELENKKKELRNQTREHPEDEEAFLAYGDAIRAFDEVKNEITNLEKSIYDFEKTFVQTEGNETLTERQIYARECLERGDIESAKKALAFEVLKKDEDIILSEAERVEEKAKILINEYMQSINTLKLDLGNPNRFSEIEHIFEEAISLEKKTNIKRESLMNYSRYLIEQGKNVEGIHYLEEYIKYCEYNDISVPFHIYYLLGTAYIKLNQYDFAEKYLQKTIDLLENPSSVDEESMKAYSYFVLAQSDMKLGEYDKSKKYFEKALDFFEKPEIKSNELFSASLSEIYASYAGLSAATDDTESMKHYANLAIETAEQIKDHIESANLIKGEVYSTVGISYAFYTDETDLAEKYLLKAKSLIEKEYEANQQKATFILIDIYKNLGLSYFMKEDCENAKEYLYKAIQYSMSVDEKNRSAYLQVVSTCSNLLSKLYFMDDDYENAEKYAKRGIEYCLKYSENTSLLDFQVVDTYDTIFNIYADQEKWDEALSLIQGVLSFIETHKIDSNTLFSLYSTIGRVYGMMGDNDNCIYYLEKALEYRTETSDFNYLSACYKLLHMSYFLKRNYEQAIFYAKELESLLLETGDKEELGESYYYLGQYYFRLEKDKEGQESIKKALNLSTNPDVLQSSYEELIASYAKENSDQFQPYLEDYEKLLSQIDPSELDIYQFYMIYNKVGCYYRNQKDYEKALPYLEKVHEVLMNVGSEMEQELGFNMVDLENCYNQMILTHQYDNKELTHKAIQLLQDTKNPDLQNQLVWYYGELATIHAEEEEKYDQALEECEQALETAKKIKKEDLDYLTVSIIYVTKAEVYRGLEDLEKAISCFEKGMEVCKKSKRDIKDQIALEMAKGILEIYETLKDEKNIKKYKKMIEKMGG